MKSSALLLALAIFSAAALGAPPAGHPAMESAFANAERPSVETVSRMSMRQHLAAELPQQGRVLSTANAGGYTYIEVKQGEQTLWIAAQALAVKPGDVIRFDNGALMDDFYSKSLNRTFPSILFVSVVAVNIDK